MTDWFEWLNIIAGIVVIVHAVIYVVGLEGDSDAMSMDQADPPLE